MKALKRNHVWLLALLMGWVLASCSKDAVTSVYVPTATDVTANATLAELLQGRTLYVNDCGRCHTLYLPENYSASQWRSLLPGMTSQTNLTPAEIQLLTKYVTKGR